MIEVATGCRLHFGLLEIYPEAENCFGGLGIMLEDPQLKVIVDPLEIEETSSTANDTLPTSANTSEFDFKLEELIQRRSRWKPNEKFLPNVKIKQPLPMHCGLGAGTQMACAIACALEAVAQSRLCEEYDAQSLQCLGVSMDWLVKFTGRGKRSAIGLKGFLEGGVILDRGYSPLSGSERMVHADSVQPPSDWRVVMVRPVNNPSVFGAKESEHFQALNKTENPNRNQMLDLAKAIVDSVVKTQFEDFCSQLEEYMFLAAKIFEPLQGGLYNGSNVGEAVQDSVKAGLRGVGQSSWGPTVFGFASNSQHASDAAKRLEQKYAPDAITISAPASTGAKIRQISPA